MKWVLVGMIVVSNTVGDILCTYGMKRRGEVDDFRPTALGRLFAEISRDRYIIGGFVALAAGFFALMALLSIAELSFAIPATAASYVVETMLAKAILKERVNWVRWAGVSLVACGVALIAF
ncbi:MAG TPA: EamA family transporter [Bryobacteraceae bacterium]|nr:EamA family transporter [Bryobacteraceae bacterium]HOL70248.1 EamA family transporter [Bryobacteraceae bacterium]HOQ44143.1 EamA family transporter [Bryobacteraceae bacterium]HPQ14187.1 EamA family transporter [Bryobacteraceae bacterium]HPU70461.1 EamA family transporter [Bryobacteraceae bacterium]